MACICWGIENNCTRKISSRDPLEIVVLKGLFSGLGSVIIGLVIGERVTALWSIPPVLLLGFVAYGLSIYFYVYAQRFLGAARTSAYYAVAPFIGVFLSLLLFHEVPGLSFVAALILMIIGYPSIWGLYAVLLAALAVLAFFVARDPERFSLLPAMGIAVLGRAASAVIAGLMWVAAYPVEGQAPFVYSVIYNGAYLVPELVICMAVAGLAGGRLLRMMKQQAKR